MGIQRKVRMKTLMIFVSLVVVLVSAGCSTPKVVHSQTMEGEEYKVGQKPTKYVLESRRPARSRQLKRLELQAHNHEANMVAIEYAGKEADMAEEMGVEYTPKINPPKRDPVRYYCTHCGYSHSYGGSYYRPHYNYRYRVRRPAAPRVPEPDGYYIGDQFVPYNVSSVGNTVQGGSYAASNPTASFWGSMGKGFSRSSYRGRSGYGYYGKSYPKRQRESYEQWRKNRPAAVHFSAGKSNYGKYSHLSFHK